MTLEEFFGELAVLLEEQETRVENYPVEGDQYGRGYVNGYLDAFRWVTEGIEEVLEDASDATYSEE